MLHDSCSSAVVPSSCSEPAPVAMVGTAKVVAIWIGTRICGVRAVLALDRDDVGPVPAVHSAHAVVTLDERGLRFFRGVALRQRLEALLVAGFDLGRA